MELTKDRSISGEYLKKIEEENKMIDKYLEHLKEIKEVNGTILEETYQVKYARIMQGVSEKLNVTLGEALVLFVNSKIYDHIKRDNTLSVNDVVEYILKEAKDCK